MSYTVVNSEHDALILENSFIKQLNPKYNILLRDDKTYPYIYIDYYQQYPRFEITRKIIKGRGIKYFGPYSTGARDIINSIYENCKLVQKKTCLKSKKLCLYYQIDKCLGPCEIDISNDTYKKELNLAKELISNKNQLLKILDKKMHFYSNELRFEEALELRERIKRIKKSQIKSTIDFRSDENYDIFVLQNSLKKAVVLRLFMRDGKIISSTHSFIQLNHGYDEDETYRRVIMDFYSNNKPLIIADILIAKEFEGLEIIKEYLSNIFVKKAAILVPQIGQKKSLIDLALLNAKELLKHEAKDDNLSLELKKLFELEVLPQRIEVFDNSHISGEATVSAMIVYDNGSFDKASYRTYKLKAKDEYAQMKETLTRRVESFSKNSPPDLWLIDGGTTLLNLAQNIADSFGVCLDIISISKEKIGAVSKRAKGRANDIVHTNQESFKLRTDDKRLQFLQKLRDEAHRSAITFHRKIKIKLDQESKLLGLKGISQAKVKKLISCVGKFSNIKKMSVEDIALILNEKDALSIKEIYK